LENIQTLKNNKSKDDTIKIKRVVMADQKQKTKKPERVQFPKGADAKTILSGIRKAQDEWAKRNPEKAHRLYPNVYDEIGNRIK
jgi:hypothetical protein